MILFRMLIILLPFLSINGKYIPSSTPIADNSGFMLSDSLIASYRMNGDVIDETGSYHGYINGAEFTTDRFSSTLSAFRFDGEKEYINLGIDFTETIDSLSMSIWIYPNTSCEPSDTLSIDPINDQYFISSGGISQSSGIYGIWNNGSLLLGQSTETRRTSHEYHAFLDDKTWHHIVVTFIPEQEEAKVYLNGDYSFTLDYITESSPTTIDSLYLGQPNFIGAQGFKGKIDDIRFYDRALSNIKIKELYENRCPDTLHYTQLHVQSDTFLYARSLIQIDTLNVNKACDLSLITPQVTISDTSKINLNSQMIIKDMSGCNHFVSIHEPHVNHRGIYINNFVSDDILGDELLEDSLINWSIAQDFNNLYLYNIGSALSSGMQVELDSFVHKANNQGLEITFVSAGYGTSFDNIEAYHEDHNYIPQGIVSEIEFWNGSGNYDIDYAPWLDRLDDLKYTVHPGDSMPLNPELQRRFYIGKIKNPGHPPSIDIAEDLISHHDEIFLTNYHSDGYNLSTSNAENSIKNKLALLAEAAMNLEETVHIVILFNVRQDSPAANIWSYFSEANEDHDFRAGFEKWYHDFLQATDITHKEYINIKGYGIYRWTDAKEAR